MNVEIKWTEAKIERAAKLWQDGLSASQIAEQIGGVSRNAVIGKASRNPELFPPRRGVGPRTVRPSKKQHAPKPKATAGIFRAPPKVVRQPAIEDILLDVPKRPGGNFRHRGLAMNDAKPIAFAQIGRLQCTWPLTDFEDEDGPDMPCCGRERRGGAAPNSPYCAEHAAIARGAA